MKTIVTHTSPDWDAIGSIWLLKKYLPSWHDASLKFVPAGQRYRSSEFRVQNSELKDPVEKFGEDEVIHVDTGLGPLDHHQTSDKNISAASLTWDFVRKIQDEQMAKQQIESEKWEVKKEAISRIIKLIVDTDHFKEVFWAEPAADYHDFSLLALLDGLKLHKPDEDDYYVTWGIECLESLTDHFENRIWAEREIKNNAITFMTRWGEGLAFETVNDSVLKLSQKMGYNIVVRKDPRKGYVRIKARPTEEISNFKFQISNAKKQDIDLTLAYEKLKKIDPEATWFLHVSKKMLLNGTPKNPVMVPTKLSLHEIVEVLKTI